MDRLSFLEGEWTGTGERGTSNPKTVSWRIDRSDRQDYLLINKFEHWSDPPGVMVTPRDARELMVLNFDARRAGYRVYWPGFYALRPDGLRGSDVAADLRLDDRQLDRTTPVSSNRKRTIRVSGELLGRR